MRESTFAFENTFPSTPLQIGAVEALAIWLELSASQEFWPPAKYLELHCNQGLLLWDAKWFRKCVSELYICVFCENSCWNCVCAFVSLFAYFPVCVSSPALQEHCLRHRQAQAQTSTDKHRQAQAQNLQSSLLTISSRWPRQCFPTCLLLWSLRLDYCDH